MALLQPRMSLKVSQRQVLTPGLMQMVSVLALNKLELKEMIDAEMVENPVLEEIDETVPMLDEVAGRQERQERLERIELSERPEQGVVAEPTAPVKDPFEEVDFGSYFQDYLDPGYRTQPEWEESDKPSFEHFLSQPTSLSDHLAWQLGALKLEPRQHEAAEYVIGNLDEDGYLAADDDELAAALRLTGETHLRAAREVPDPEEALALVRQAIDLVQHLDPAGVGARDLRECLLIQITAQQLEFSQLYTRQSTEPGASSSIASNDDLHGSFRVEADARLEDRRRSMEVAAMIVA